MTTFSRLGSKLLATAAVAALAPVLVACPGGTTGTSTGPSGAIVMETYCDRGELSPPSRQTVVIIDERGLAPITAPSEMRTTNAALFELVSGLADANLALRGGAMAPRERLTIYLAAASGTAPRLLFSGCIPGISAAEEAEMQAERSGARNASDAFFGRTLTQEIEEAQAPFYSGALTAVSRAAQALREPVSSGGAFQESSLLSAMRSVPRLTPEGPQAARHFIYTDLSQFDLEADVPEARRVGFEHARSAGLSLAGAEVYLVGSGDGGAREAREYADAFFLGSQGDLMSWGGVAFNSLTAPPVEVREYAGEIVYPADRFPMRLRLAVAQDGELVNSWLIIRSDGEWFTPLSGVMVCGGDDCRLTSDQGGLAQAWSLDPDPDPEFTLEMPLSGLRSLEAELTDESATGRIFDPLVSEFADAPGVDSLRFALSRQQQ